jgi:septal ring factor EnvC (AmiA/AmiB activator)
MAAYKASLKNGALKSTEKPLTVENSELLAGANLAMASDTARLKTVADQAAARYAKDKKELEKAQSEAAKLLASFNVIENKLEDAVKTAKDLQTKIRTTKKVIST